MLPFMIAVLNGSRLPTVMLEQKPVGRCSSGSFLPLSFSNLRSSCWHLCSALSSSYKPPHEHDGIISTTTHSNFNLDRHACMRACRDTLQACRVDSPISTCQQLTQLQPHLHRGEHTALSCSGKRRDIKSHANLQATLTTRHRGTTPNSTAVLPRTTNRQRSTGWSAVDTSDTSSLGPIPSRRMCRKDAGLLGGRKR